MKPHPIEAGPGPDGVPRAVHVPRAQRTALVGREDETGIPPCCASGAPVSVRPSPGAPAVPPGFAGNRHHPAGQRGLRLDQGRGGVLRRRWPGVSGGLCLGPARRAPDHTLHVSRLGLAHMAGSGIVAPPSSLAPDCPVRGRRV
jgi:hypothetical protein